MAHIAMQRHVAGRKRIFTVVGFCFRRRIRHIGGVMTLATGGPRWRAAHVRGAAAHPRNGALTQLAVLSRWVGALAFCKTATALLESALKKTGAAARGAAIALLTGVVCLALIITPAAALDAQGGHPAVSGMLLNMESCGPERLNVAQSGHDRLDHDHLDHDHLDHDRASPDGNRPDLHGAHHCCHSHVAPAQSFRSIAPTSVRHLTWRVGDSDVLPPRSPAPPLRPPRA